MLVNMPLTSKPAQRATTSLSLNVPLAQPLTMTVTSFNKFGLIALTLLLHLSVIAAVTAVGPLQMSANLEETNTTEAVIKVLHRHKRYLAFPDGSSVSAAICLTIGMIGNPNTNFISWAVNWGVAYNLPNHNWVLQHVNGFANQTKAMLQRRSRRSFYEQVETAFDHMGYNGRACVARALCETAQQLQARRLQPRGNMLEQLVHTILSLPLAPVEAREPPEHHQYDAIYRSAAQSEQQACSNLYPDCKFSLLELALGHYAAVGPMQLKSYNFM